MADMMVAATVAGVREAAFRVREAERAARLEVHRANQLIRTATMLPGFAMQSQFTPPDLK